MNIENKKNDSILVSIIIVLSIIIAFLIIFSFFGGIRNNKSTSLDNNLSDEKIDDVSTNCQLTKFDDDYKLLKIEKSGIAKSIEKMEGFNDKIDTQSIEITDVSKYYLNISFKIKNSEDDEEISAIVFKVDDVFKCYTFGSDYTKEQVDELEYILEIICS